MKPIILLLMFFMVGCNSNGKKIISSGEIIDRTYYSRELNWNIEIPEKYTVDTDEKLEKSTDLRNEIFKTPDGLKYVPTDLNLITFRKDQDNFFSSSVTSMNRTNLTFPDLQEAIVKSIDRTYSSLENIRHKLQVSEIKIGNLVFNKIKIEVRNVTTDELVINQDLYNTLIDNKVFSASINYNSDREKEVMERAFFSSVESKKTLGYTI